MILCRISIPFSSRLSVPSGAFFNFNYEDKLVGLEIICVQGKSITSYSDKLDWLNIPGSKRAAISAKKGKNEENILEVFFSENGIYGKGFVQPNRFSYLNIYFEMDSTDFLKNKENLNSTKLWIERSINYFIDHYLEIGCDNDIPGFKIDNVPIASISTSKNYKFSKDEVSGNFVHAQHEFKWFKTEKSGHLKQDFPYDWLCLLQEKLASDKAVPIYNKLLMDAKRQSYHYGNHDLSIVLCETSFEVFVSSCLLELFKKNKLDKVPLKIRKEGKTTVSIEEFCETQNVGPLLTKISDIIGESLKDRKEHRDWKTIAYEIRNKIVHRGASGYSEADAENAFKAIQAYMNCLRNLLNNDNNSSK